MSSGLEPVGTGVFTRLHRSQRGQTTLFILCSFFTLFLFFALVANVGQAANRRVMLQMLADIGAFSGASAQGTGLNMVSYYNQMIYDSWKLTELAMLFFTIHICGVDDAITGAYKIARTIFAIALQVANHAGAVWAFTEAERVTRLNAIYLFPDGSLRTPLQQIPNIFSSPGSALDTASHIYNMNQAWPAFFKLPPELVELEENTNVEKYWVCVYWIGVESKNDSFDRWFRKDKDKEDQVTRFYWWVTADEVDALVLPGLFGKVPKMTAVALAKPIGGRVKHGDMSWFSGGDGAKYVAKMIPLETIDPLFVNLTGFPGLVEVKH